MSIRLKSLFSSKKVNASGRLASTLYQFDKSIGFWGLADIVGTLPSLDPVPVPMTVRHNNDGNRDIPFNRQGNGKSIICIGGSHTWGGGIADDRHRYSNILREMTGRNILNLGHASLGLDQICLAVMKKTKQYNPEIIVVEQYPWALVRILNNYVNGYIKPNFYLDNLGNLQLKKVPFYARFRLFRKILGSYYSFKKELTEFKQGIDIVNQYDPMADPIFMYWKAGHYDYMYKLVELIIVVLRDYCRKNNVRLVFALGAIYQQFQEASPSCLVDYDLPRNRLKQILDKLNVSYVDMTNAMLAAHSNESPVIFSDGHINQKGNRIFADVLYGDLKNRGWL